MKKLLVVCLLFLAFGIFSPIYAIDTLTETESTKSSSFIDGKMTDSWLPPSSATRSATIKGFSALGLPDTFILPSSIFYPIKLLVEKITIYLTFDQEKKIETTLKYAENRLAEAYKMIEQSKFSKADEILKMHATEIEQAKTQILSSQIPQDVKLQLTRKLEANVIKQQAVIDYFYAKAGTTAATFTNLPDLALNAVEKAIEVLSQTDVATPSYEMQKRIQEIITGDEYTKDRIQQLETKFNEKILRELQKFGKEETSSGAALTEGMVQGVKGLRSFIDY